MSILALPGFYNPFVVECDASCGVGVVLKQSQHPTSFESIKLQPNENVYSIYDRDVGHHACLGQIPIILGRQQVCGEN